MTETQNAREIKQVGYPLKMRTLTVKSVKMLGPQLKQIILGGPDLQDFQSGSPDDHIKAFFSPNGEEPVVPVRGPEGLSAPEGKAVPPMRDYTPVSFDGAKEELELIFFLHDHGPAANWGKAAEPGHKLVIGGPRGSRITPYAWDWYLMIGDESAIPSFKRRLSEMPADAEGIVLIEINDGGPRIEFTKPQGVRVEWIERRGQPAGQSTRLREALEILVIPEGEYYAWVKGETTTARALAEYLTGTRGARKEWMKVSGYWDLEEDPSAV